MVRQHLIELIEGGMHRNESIGEPLPFHTLGGQPQRFTVTVNADEPNLRRGLEEGDGMAGKAQGAIHCDGVLMFQGRCHQVHAIVKQYRQMNIRHINHQNSTSGNTSSAISEYPSSFSAR